MNARVIAALFAAVALPVAAQNAAPRGDAERAPVRAQAKEDKPATAKERVKIAKKKQAKQKQDKQKKAPAN